MEYTQAERKDDFYWFLDNYDDIYKTYGHKIIVIKNKEILGTFDSFVSAIKETSKKYELGTFIVQECNGDESGYTNYISSWQLV